MKKTGLFSALILCLLLLVPTSNGHSRDKINVRFKNIGNYSVYFLVCDHVCRVRAFRGRLSKRSTTSVSLCLGGDGRAAARLYDMRTGNRFGHYSPSRSQTINIKPPRQAQLKPPRKALLDEKFYEFNIADSPRCRF